MVIVRIGLGLTTDGPSAGSAQMPIHFFNSGPRKSVVEPPRSWLPGKMQRKADVPEFRLEPLQVNVTTTRNYEHSGGAPHSNNEVKQDTYPRSKAFGETGKGPDGIV